MNRYEVELLPAAYSDLEQIFDYIMADNPQAAANMLEQIMISLSRLENYPYSGKPLLDRSLREFSFRMVIIDSYIAFYRIVNGRVFVYHILHGSRKYRSPSTGVMINWYEFGNRVYHMFLNGYSMALPVPMACRPMRQTAMV